MKTQPATMNDADFRSLVRAMRTAQRAYFKSRDRAVLDEAVRLEREVDAALDATESTGDLFGGTA